MWFGRLISPSFVHVASGEPVDVELPNQWLWDIIDEFVYQVRTHAYVSVVYNFCWKYIL